MSRSVWLLLIIMGVGLFWRTYRFESRLAFDFDSEFFAWEAKKILVDRKLTLVGQESSVMGVFIAPLYTYLSTLVYAALGMNPVAGGVLAVIFGVAATVLLYLSAKHLAGGGAGLLAAVFYQWLVFGVSWDWSASALNGMFVVSLLWLYALLRRWWWLNLVSVGLAFHFHPTAAVLTVASAIWLGLYRRQVSRRDWLVGIGGLATLLSPLLVFELRHGFVISRSLGVAGLADGGGLANVVEVTRVFLNAWGGWLYGPHYATAFEWMGVVGAFLVWGWFKSRRRLGRFWSAYSVLLVTTLLALILYPQHITDYYPMVIYGPTMVAMAVSVNLVRVRLVKAVVGGALIWLAIINLWAWSLFTRPFNMQAKKQAVDWIVTHANGRKFNLSDSFISPGYNTGYNYLFWWRGVSLEKQNPEIIYSLVIPSWYKEIVPKVEIGGIGIEWGEVLR